MKLRLETYPAFPRSKFSEWYETTNYDEVEWDGWHMTGYDEPIRHTLSTA